MSKSRGIVVRLAQPELLGSLLALLCFDGARGAWDLDRASPDGEGERSSSRQTIHRTQDCIGTWNGDVDQGEKLLQGCGGTAPPAAVLWVAAAAARPYSPLVAIVPQSATAAVTFKPRYKPPVTPSSTWLSRRAPHAASHHPASPMGRARHLGSREAGDVWRRGPARQRWRQRRQAAGPSAASRLQGCRAAALCLQPSKQPRCCWYALRQRSRKTR